MVATNDGKSGLALLMSPSGNRPDSISIGSGSGVVSVSNTNLISERFNSAFTTVDISVQKEVTFTSDFSASSISGLLLREFGVKKSGGNVWNREGFSPITFDGSNELQIQVTFQVF